MVWPGASHVSVASSELGTLGAAHAEEEVGQPEDRQEREDARSEKHRADSRSMCADGEGPDYQRDRDGDERVVERFLRELDASIVGPTERGRPRR
jgi:hypothetical protein